MQNTISERERKTGRKRKGEAKMKKIINGRLYNTETAKAIGVWDNGQPGGFDWVCETLYLKHNGEFFVCGEGGANSIYSTPAQGNDWRAGGWRIVPLTYDEARKFAEEKLSPEEYGSVFSISDEAENSIDTVTIKVTLTRVAKQLIDNEARKTGDTIGNVISRIAETLRE